MELVKYDAMVNAIAICESVDEVKDIRDKAIALEVYARQAKNFDAERKCATVRVRAERQCGILLSQTEKAKGGWAAKNESCTSEMVDQDKPKTITEMGLTHKESAQFQKLAAIEEDVFEQRIQAVLEEDSKKPTASKIINPKNRVELNTGDEEWYTPQKYIESARMVLGGIDLDPASNDCAQGKVRADAYYTVNDDGLVKDWRGSVWLNPPYTSGVINKFIDKAILHYLGGDITQAIVLTNNSADTTWFQKAAFASAAMCFTAGRISFYKDSGDTGSPTQGQTFFYFGPDVDGFFREFSQYGFVVQRVSML